MHNTPNKVSRNRPHRKSDSSFIFTEQLEPVDFDGIPLNTQEVQPQEVDNPKVKRVRRERKRKASKDNLPEDSSDEEES